MIFTRKAFLKLTRVHVPQWCHRAYFNGITFDFIDTREEELVWLSLLLMEDANA